MASKRNVTALCALVLTLAGAHASGQALDTVGSRASGMAGAFVAVATDSSAVWWNPGALPTGPFVDASMSRAVTQNGSAVPGSADRATAVAVALPLLGVHVARYDHASARPGSPGTTALSRLAVTQTGLTLVQSIVSGVHVGGTVKYLRSGLTTARRFVDVGRAVSAAQGLAPAASEGAWDADLGVMAVHRVWRVGLLARQLGAPSFGTGADAHRLGRHVRAGVAFDAAAADGPPLVVAADIDLTRVESPEGPVRAAAVGVERWVRGGKVGLRGGVQVNTASPSRPSAAAGASLMVKSGLFLEVSGTAGGDRASRGWGATARFAY